MAPQFSVIMPAYRAADVIPVALRSVQGQTLDDLEVVVVDDGSGDETPAVVRDLAGKDPRIKLIEQENAGTAAARNTAIAASSGRILALLDNDDAWLPNHLEGVAAAFAEVPGAGLAFADAWTYNQETSRVFRRSAMTDRAPTGDYGRPAGLLRALGTTNFVIASGSAFLREAYDAAGPFDPAISGSDDWDMWLRIAAAGYGGVKAGSEPQIVLRDSASSQSKDLAMILRTSVDVLDHALARPEPEPGALDPARRTRAEFTAELDAMENSGPRTWPRSARNLAARTKVRVLRRWLWRPAPGDLRRLLDQ